MSIVMLPVSKSPGSNSILSTAFRLDQALVDPRMSTISIRGRQGRVEPAHLRVLSELVARPGQIVSRRRLKAVLTGGSGEGSDQSLSRAISTLRRLLGDCARDSRLIETITGEGYQLLIAPQPVAADQQQHGHLGLTRNRIASAFAAVCLITLAGVLGRTTQATPPSANLGSTASEFEPNYLYLPVHSASDSLEEVASAARMGDLRFFNGGCPGSSSEEPKPARAHVTEPVLVAQ